MNYAGAVWLSGAGLPTVLNCGFYGNAATWGGGIYAQFPALTATVANCTFSGNSATNYGGAWQASASALNAMNCVLWDNRAGMGGAEIYTSGGAGTTVVAWCDVKGGWNGTGVGAGSGGTNLSGGGNIDSDPLFVGGTNGAWSGGPIFDPTNFQSTLLDALGGWFDN